MARGPGLADDADRSQRRLALAPRTRLDLDVDAKPFGRDHLQRLGQRRYLLARVFGCEPAPRVEEADLLQRRGFDPPGTVGGAFQRLVMDDDGNPVAGQLGVELDPAGTQSLCCAESGKRVLGRAHLGAAMADDGREPERRRKQGSVPHPSIASG